MEARHVRDPELRDPVWIEDYVVRSSEASRSDGGRGARAQASGSWSSSGESCRSRRTPRRALARGRAGRSRRARGVAESRRTSVPGGGARARSRARRRGGRGRGDRVRETAGEVPPPQAEPSGPSEPPSTGLRSSVVAWPRSPARGRRRGHRDGRRLAGALRRRPLGLGILAVVLAYRAYRSPYEPEGARKRSRLEDCSSTERMLPAGSLNQAIGGPAPARDALLVLLEPVVALERDAREPPARRPRCRCRRRGS